MTNRLPARAEAAPTWRKHGPRRSVVGSSTETWRPISPARCLTAGINAAAAVRWQRALDRLALDPVAGGGPR